MRQRTVKKRNDTSLTHKAKFKTTVCPYVHSVCYVQSCSKVLVILWKRQFYFCTVAHVLVVESANKLAKVLEHVLRSKKYKKSFWKFSQEGCQLSTLPSKLEYFAVTAVIRELVIGWANKLAEVLEHVLGVKIPKRVFENSVGKASNDEAKIRTQQNS